MREASLAVSANVRDQVNVLRKEYGDLTQDEAVAMLLELHASMKRCGMKIKYYPGKWELQEAK